MSTDTGEREQQYNAVQRHEERAHERGVFNGHQLCWDKGRVCKRAQMKTLTALLRLSVCVILLLRASSTEYRSACSCSAAAACVIEPVESRQNLLMGSESE